MVLLGQRLQAQGHTITLAAPIDFADDAASAKLSFAAVGGPIRDYLDHNAQAILGGGLPFLKASIGYIEQAMRAQFSVLPEVARGADLILGCSLQFAGPSIAEKYNVPYRFIAFNPVLFRSDFHSPVAVAGQRWPVFLRRMQWSFTDRHQDSALGARANVFRDKLGLAAEPSFHRHLLSSRPILAADRALFPPPPDAPSNLTVIPALLGANRTPLPAKLEAFLEDGPPPIYLGFGSMPDPHPGDTTSLLVDAIKLAGCRALLSSGWARLHTRETLPASIFLLDSVSHEMLFTRVSAVVHHGGAGTTTMAARAGVPQLLVPHLLDQHYNAERIHRLGLGPSSIKRRNLTVGNLARALRALASDAFATRAKAFASESSAARERDETMAIQSVVG